MAHGYDDYCDKPGCTVIHGNFSSCEEAKVKQQAFKSRKVCAIIAMELALTDAHIPYSIDDYGNAVVHWGYYVPGMEERKRDKCSQ